MSAPEPAIRGFLARPPLGQPAPRPAGYDLAAGRRAKALWDLAVSAWYPAFYQPGLSDKAARPYLSAYWRAVSALRAFGLEGPDDTSVSGAFPGVSPERRPDGSVVAGGAL